MLRRIIIIIAFILTMVMASVFVYRFGFQKSYRQIASGPTTESGILDLSDIDFSETPYLKISGKFRFYWKQLFTPVQLNAANDSIPYAFIEVPGVWNGFIVNGKEIRGKGFATYNLRITVPEDDYYGLKIKEFDSAYKIWINGNDSAEIGLVGPEKHLYRPSWRREEIYFSSDSNMIDIVLQIANFHHRKGGPEDSVIIGLAENIIRFKNIQYGISFFLLGILIIMWIYHLVLYVYRRGEKPILLFSFLSLIIAMRLMTTGEKLILELFPFLSWGLAIRLEYLAFILALPLFLWFFNSLFISEFPRLLCQVVTYISIMFGGIVLFFPPLIFSHIPIVFLPFLGILATYGLIGLALAMIRNRENSLILFSGYFIFFLLLVNDIMYYNRLFDTSYLIHFGLFVMIMSQAFVLSRKTSVAFTEVERLSEELEKYSQELETRVLKRTSRVLRQKNKIETQAKILKEKNLQLQELDNFKNELTGMIIHDLKNPLNIILNATDLSYSDNQMNLIRQSGFDMLQIVQNILDIQKYEDAQLELNISSCLISDLCHRARQQVQFLSETRNNPVFIEIDDDIVIALDQNLMERVFINMITNALKYSPEGETVLIRSEIKDDELKIWIIDKGKGIKEDKQEYIFEKFAQIDAKRAGHTRSSGLGLTFCKMTIEAHGGKIGVESKYGSGAKFWFTLPMTSKISNAYKNNSRSAS